MKRFLLVALALVLMVSCVALAEETLLIVPDGTRTTNPGYVVPTLDGGSTGYKAMGSYTWSLASAPTRCPTLPAGTKAVKFYVRQTTCTVAFGPSTVATGTAWPQVASETATEWFTVATLTPSIYGVSIDPATVSVIPK